MATSRRNNSNQGKRVTRYTHDDVKEPRTPETGHTSLLPTDEQVVALPMDNGWSKAIKVGKLAEDDRPLLVDIDPAADPALFWAGKRNRREVPVLPLQRNEIVSESRIAQIIQRARKAAEEKGPQPRQGSLFADLEKTLRESEKQKRVEFYTHEEGWKNKLICGDSLHVMESLLQYENLRGKVQMIYIDPPYGIKYDSNFQQRIDSTKNDEKDQADDVLTIKAFRDTWALGVHSYLGYLQERLYLCRELLSDTGSIFVQMGDENAHLVRTLLDEVFGRTNFLSEIVFFKTSGKGAAGLDAVYDVLLWYAKDRPNLKYRQIYVPRPPHTLAEQYTLVELADGSVRRITDEEAAGTKQLPHGAKRFMPGDLSSQGSPRRVPSLSSTRTTCTISLPIHTGRPRTLKAWRAFREKGVSTRSATASATAAMRMTFPVPLSPTFGTTPSSADMRPRSCTQCRLPQRWWSAASG